MLRSALSSLSSLSLLFITGSLLVGADCLGGVVDDDDDGEPLISATDGGAIQRLSGTDSVGSTVWTGEIASANRVSVVADAAAVYVGAGSVLSSFPLDGSGDHEEAWTWAAPDDVVALAGPGSGAVYVMTTSTLHAISTSAGGELWSVDLLLDLSGVADDAIAFASGSLIVGGDPTRRLDPSNGDVTHTYATGSTDVSDIAISGGTAYLATGSGVVAVAASDLSEQWTLPTSAAVDEVASGADGVAYAVRGGVIGVATSGGNPVFDSGDETGVFDALVVSQNLVMAARADGTVLALDEADGTEVWQAALAGPVGGLDANAQTAFYGHADVIEALAMSDGSSLWSLVTTGNPAAVLAL